MSLPLQIPVSLHKLVSDKLANIIRKKDPDSAAGKNLLTLMVFANRDLVSEI